MKRICPYCNKKIDTTNNKRLYGGHIGSCSLNPNRLDGLKRMKQKRLERSDRKNYKFICVCGKEYLLNLTKHNFKNGNYKKHCSYKCSNSRDRPDDVKQKISKTLKITHKNNPELRKILSINCRHLHTIKTKEKMRKRMKIKYKCGKLKYFINSEKNGNNVHRKLEKKWKPKIEKYFNTINLKPEKINNNWFDFTNNKYIIEFTIDNTSGITNAIRRFSNIKHITNRKKYLVCPDHWFGSKRKQQLKNTNVTFINMVDIV